MTDKPRKRPSRKSLPRQNHPIDPPQNNRLKPQNKQEPTTKSTVAQAQTEAKKLQERNPSVDSRMSGRFSRPFSVASTLSTRSDMQRTNTIDTETDTPTSEEETQKREGSAHSADPQLNSSPKREGSAPSADPPTHTTIGEGSAHRTDPAPTKRTAATTNDINTLINNHHPKTLEHAIDLLDEMHLSLPKNPKERRKALKLIRSSVGKRTHQRTRTQLNAELESLDKNASVRKNHLPILLSQLRDVPATTVLAILDSGASKTVAGEQTLYSYLHSRDIDINKIEKTPSVTQYSFAGGGTARAAYSVKIPVKFFDKEQEMECDVLTGAGRMTAMLISAAVLRENHWLIDVARDKIYLAENDNLPLNQLPHMPLSRSTANLPEIKLWNDENDHEIYNAISNTLDTAAAEAQQLENDQTNAEEDIRNRKEQEAWAEWTAAQEKFKKNNPEDTTTLNIVKQKTIQALQDGGVQNFDKLWDRVQQDNEVIATAPNSVKDIWRKCTRFLAERTYKNLTRNKRPTASTRIATSIQSWACLDVFMWGEAYYCLYLNLYSRYTKIFKLENQMTSDELIDILQELDRTAMLTQNLITDAGKQLTSRIITAYLRKKGTRHFIAAGQSHWTNGSAERRIRTVKEASTRYRNLIRNNKRLGKESEFRILTHITDQLNSLRSKELEGKAPKQIQFPATGAINEHLPNPDSPNPHTDFEETAHNALKALTETLTCKKFLAELSSIKPKLLRPKFYNIGDIIETCEEQNGNRMGWEEAEIVGHNRKRTKYWIIKTDSTSPIERSWAQLQPATTRQILDFPPHLKEIRIDDLVPLPDATFGKDHIKRTETNKEEKVEPKQHLTLKEQVQARLDALRSIIRSKNSERTPLQTAMLAAGTAKTVTWNDKEEIFAIPSKEEESALICTARAELEQDTNVECTTEQHRDADNIHSWMTTNKHFELATTEGTTVRIHFAAGMDTHEEETNTYNHFVNNLASEGVPTYSQDEAVERIINRRHGNKVIHLSKADPLWDHVIDQHVASTEILRKLIVSFNPQLDRRIFTTPEQERTARILILNLKTKTIHEHPEQHRLTEDEAYLQLDILHLKTKTVDLDQLGFTKEELKTGRIDITEAQAIQLGIHDLYVAAVSKEVESIRKTYKCCEILNKADITDPKEQEKVRQALTSRVIVQIKINPTTNTFVKIKARWVVRGFQDPRANLSDFRCDAETVSDIALRLISQVAANRNWQLRFYDFECAFLQGDIYAREEDKVFMRLPTNLTTGPFGLNPNQIAKCHKSLYGLKDAPAQWRRKVRKILIQAGFRESMSDPCVLILERNPEKRGIKPPTIPSYQNYTKVVDELRVEVDQPDDLLAVIGIHVDDSYIAAHNDFFTSPELWPHLAKTLKAGAAEIPSESPQVFTGKNVSQNLQHNKVTVDMDHYGKKLEKISIPADILERMKTEETTPFTDPTTGQEFKTPEGKSKYQQLVGGLRWANTMRSEIGFNLGIASQSNQAPTWQGIKLLNEAIDMLAEPLPTVFEKQDQSCIVGIADAALRTSRDGAAQQGTIILLADKQSLNNLESIRGTPLVIKSTLQRRKASSSAGAELLALRATANLAEYCQTLACELGLVSQSDPITLATDARDVEAATQTTKKPTEINLQADYHQLRSKVKANIYKVMHIPGKSNPADPLTKSIAESRHTMKILVESLKTNIWNLAKTNTAKTQSINFTHSKFYRALQLTTTAPSGRPHT